MKKRIGSLRDDVVVAALSASLIVTSLFSPTFLMPHNMVQAESNTSVRENRGSVLAAFDSDAEGFGGYNGYNYSAGKENPIMQGGVPAEVVKTSYDSLHKRVVMMLDYSRDKQYGWSEAKIGTVFQTPVSISGYNCLRFEVVYPEGFTFTPNVYATGGTNGSVIINTQGKLQDVTVNGDGTCTAKAVVEFEGTNLPMTQLILSTVGRNTDFVGEVSIGQLILCQTMLEGEVEITEPVKKTLDVADIGNMPHEIEIADKEAIGSVAALASYLVSLQRADQVLFGQQYATTSHVRALADGGSDAKDVTGSYPAVMGIDSLSITGSEGGATSKEEALYKAIEVSKEAARNGLLLSVSMHMPNFTNKKIVKTEQGYDFFSCDFEESKDMSGDPVGEILSGGASKEAFYAYLDVIAEYALALQEEKIPVLFRPFHENNGNWFWWGTAINSEQYKELYHSMAAYLREQGVHNLLYVYSPNGPFESKEEYLERYPGDEYVDVVAMDYYDDHCDYTANLKGTFIERLSTSCKVINSIATEHGKVAAIAETGVRVQREDGSMEGLLLSENPIKGQSWYENVLKVAVENDMPYFLLWANFGTDNFYVPFKYSNTTGHELVNEFIQFYNHKASIFANGTKFYGKDGASSKAVTVIGSKEKGEIPVVPDVPPTTPIPTATPQATIKPQATATPQATIKPQATATPQATIKPQATVKPKPTKKPQPTKAPSAKVKAMVSNSSIVAGKTTSIKISGLSKEEAKKLVYKSTDNKIATVSSTGMVKGKKAGKVTMKAYYKDTLVGTMTVTVKKAVPVKKIQFTKKTVTLKKGTCYQLRIKTTPIKMTDSLSYTTSASKIATVSKTGIVTAKKSGKAVITVKASSGKKATVKIVCR